MRFVVLAPCVTWLNSDTAHNKKSRYKSKRDSLIAFFVVLAAGTLCARPAKAQTFGCSPAMANDIVCENSKTGNPASQWDISTHDAGDPTIQGFATDISVAQGQTISFKVNTTAKSYRLDIYRLGYYQGNGARLITTVQPSVSLPQNQPACLTNPTTNLLDCGNWAVSASWTVPSNATSGIYIAHLVRADTGGNSHIVFIVRNDSSHSAILFQTEDETWEAYNDWGGTAGPLGGHSLYGGPNNWDYTQRAYKVSYNRPYDTRAYESASWVFNNDYPMIRWLEANGYDVTYSTHVDGVRNSTLIQNHKILFMNGHDEYWSGPLRTNVEAARDAGINLAFFTGNDVFWKTRWENSTDSSDTPYRTMVCYKETFTESQTDPEDPPTWTGTWRDPTSSPPDDAGKPENSLTGTLFMVNGPGSDNTGLAIKVPAADGQMRFWRNTSLASLAPGTTATLPNGTLGFEWDVDADNGFRPAGTFDLSTATYTLTTDYLLDNGVTYGAGTATHHMTMHRAPSGALIFGAGTVQWAWGLDSTHDNNFGFPTPGPDGDMEQATVNLLADMGVQPATLETQYGMGLATQSTDTTPPSSAITYPTAGTALPLNTPVTVTGIASDVGGAVAGVEISIDGGVTWHPATGRSSWTYTFTPTNNGRFVLESRAVDDSGNIEAPKAGMTITSGTTYSISGTISPASTGAGTTVNLTGPWTISATTDNNGNYNFIGLTNGQYTVQPSKPGYAISPANIEVTISGANVAGINFTSTAAPPETLFTTQTPDEIGNSDGPTANYELGTVFESDTAGQITAIRFWKDAHETGTHTGHIWSASGTSLASVTFTGETASGWQTQNLSTPLTIAANTPYTVSVNTGNTYYVVSVGGLSSTVSNVDLSSIVGNNGVYGSPGTFPSGSWEYSNYFRDVVFTASVASTYTISGTISGGGGSTVTLSSGGTTVTTTTADYTGNYSFNGLSNGSYTVTPSLQGYSFSPASNAATVSGSNVTGVNFTASTVTSSETLFTTQTPVAIGNSDGPNANYELGTVFQSDIAGQITGIRFWKDSHESGTHTGHIWSSSGALLATVTFSGETASGWQTQNLTTPLTIAANTQYTVSVNTGNTYYVATLNGLSSVVTNMDLSSILGNNGVFASAGIFPTGSWEYSNYFRDVVFSPTVTATYTISGTISGIGGESVTLSSGSTTVATTTADASGNYGFAGVVNGSYTVTPALSGYTFSPANKAVTVSGANVTGINFTSTTTPTETLFTTQTPVATGNSDGPSANYELGTVFQSDIAGQITAIRFWKDANESGTHTGHIWSASGTLLATVTFTTETSSGWQTQNLTTPLAISANTQYVVSVNTGNTYYVATIGGLASTVTNKDLSSIVGNNGVFAEAGSFPTGSWQNSNYFRDVVFTH